MNNRWPRLVVSVILVGCWSALGQASQPEARWWPDAVDVLLTQSGTNRQELVKALEQVPVNQRQGLVFLLENMPLLDLQSLSSDFLLDNLALSYRASQETPWAQRVPAEIFLNDVLPYASLTEARENWRRRLYETCRPLVKDCKTPSEAAQVLNQQIFKLLNVKYSMKRRASDQGPLETMETGVASCTGLSILLVDACRAVGVPARVVGTPLWSNMSGNHTWVEIWDAGWHFTGAAEQDPKGLNRGWFVGNAAQASADDPTHGIYASSFKKTGLSFPMSWAPEVDYVSATNVTARYAAGVTPAVVSGLSLIVDVFDRPAGERVAARVVVMDAQDPSLRFEGTSRGETADMNDHLALQMPKHRTYVVEVEAGADAYRQHYTTGAADADQLAIFLSGIPPVPAPPPPFYSSPPISGPLAVMDAITLRMACDAFFAASTNEQAVWTFPRGLEDLLRDNEQAVRRAVWDAYSASPVHDSLKSDAEAGKVCFNEHTSPYTMKTVGKRPEKGWPLFIAMHGGGGAPKDVNDSQWLHMQRYYRDHPEVGGYRYVALRAPNDTWNGFYTGYVYPLIQTLLRQCYLFADVDPNKTFIMGYSHGGYGAFAIGMKMPDHFAAIHASAAAPTDGAGPITLRNTTFTAMIGGEDTAHGRRDGNLKFEAELQELRGDRTDIYPVTVQLIADHPHSGLPDRDKIAEMYPNVRNPVPRELTWRLSDAVVGDFFWLHAPVPEPGKTFNVTCKDNRLTVTTDLSSASILLDGRLIDFGKPVVLAFNGKTSTHELVPSVRTLCETMQRRGDPELAFTAELRLAAEEPGDGKEK